MILFTGPFRLECKAHESDPGVWEGSWRLERITEPHYVLAGAVCAVGLSTERAARAAALEAGLAAMDHWFCVDYEAEHWHGPPAGP